MLSVTASAFILYLYTISSNMNIVAKEIEAFIINFIQKNMEDNFLKNSNSKKKLQNIILL